MPEKNKELKYKDVPAESDYEVKMREEDAATDYAEPATEDRTLGQIVKERRTLNPGMSQQALADKIGLGSSEYIGMIENGQRNLDLNRIPLLAAALNLNPGELTKIALRQYFPLAYKAVFDTEKHPGAPSEHHGGQGALESMELSQIVSDLHPQLQDPLLHMQEELRELALFLRKHMRARVITSRRPAKSKA